MKFHVGTGRDVSVGTLNDDQQLVLAELVDALVRSPQMSQNRQVAAVLVEQNRIVRGHQAARGVRNQRGPRVLDYEAADLIDVVELEVRVLSHRAVLSVQDILTIRRSPGCLAEAGSNANPAVPLEGGDRRARVPLVIAQPGVCCRDSSN